MIPQIPLYITLIVIALNFGIAIAVWSILSTAAGRTDLAPGTVRRVRIGTALFLAAWLGGALALAPDPASLATRDRFYLSPFIQLFAGGSIAIVLLTLWRSAAFLQVVAAASLPALIGVQLYRTIGAVFLVLLALGQVPAHFALPAGWGDVAIGLTAPLVALALARGFSSGRTLAASWNVIGLVDLVVAVGTGTGVLVPLLMPELGPRVPPTAAMGIFPMFIVPAFAVPISVLLHLVALGRLRQERRVTSGLMPRTAHH